MRRMLFFLLLSFFLLSLCFPAAAPAENSERTLQVLSAEIHTQLDGLKQQSRNLTEQLLIAERELQASSKQVETLQTELNELNSCLVNTNQKLSEYSEKLTEYETKLKFRAKVIAIATAALIVFLTVRGVLLVLKIKFGIKIPYFLNLIL